jgi:hypothetical protein
VACRDEAQGGSRSDWTAAQPVPRPMYTKHVGELWRAQLGRIYGKKSIIFLLQGRRPAPPRTTSALAGPFPSSPRRIHTRVPARPRAPTPRLPQLTQFALALHTPGPPAGCADCRQAAPCHQRAPAPLLAPRRPAAQSGQRGSASPHHRMGPTLLASPRIGSKGARGPGR